MVMDPDASVQEVLRDLVEFIRGAEQAHVLVTGDPRPLRQIAKMAQGVNWIPSKQTVKLIIFSKDTYHLYEREDVSTIPASFRRWFEKQGEDACCTVCLDEKKVNVATCSKCNSDTCIDCFLGIVDYDDDVKVFKCPNCRHVSLAVDALQPRAERDDMPAVKVWDALREVLAQYSRQRAGLVVAKHPYTAVLDARINKEGRVILEGSRSTRQVAQRLITKMGAVIGVGELPEYARDVSSVAGDPLARGFLVLKDGRAVRLLDGWKYVLGVFV